MSKLVLRLPDGSTREFALGRERVTIGRRADNDICLPFPAVSGEHAAVVTILDDSFLEDLHSTNGTLVNGKAITKHFLRDRDEIDIGRHTLVYLTGEGALPAFDAAVPAPITVTENGGATIGDDEATVVTPARPRAADAAPARPQSVTHRVFDTPNDAPADAPLLEVLEGPSAGHTVSVVLDEFVLGRPGVQLAAVRRTAHGFRLAALEGEARPQLNGRALPDEGALLKPGDEILVAGTRLLWRPALQGE